MNIETIKAQALQHGYRLRRISSTAVETARQVAAGANTTGKIARLNRLAENTAHMRLRAAERAGLIREADHRNGIFVFEPTIELREQLTS